MEFLKIIGLCITAAIAYGIVHDQITARACVEYFTIGHPRIIDSESPTVLALMWGIIATWWAGAIIGVPLAIAARVAGKNKMTARTLLRPISILILSMGVIAFIAAQVALVLIDRGTIYPSSTLMKFIPIEKHATYIAVAWAHMASYLSGFIGGIVVIAVVLFRRFRSPDATTNTA